MFNRSVYYWLLAKTESEFSPLPFKIMINFRVRRKDLLAKIIFLLFDFQMKRKVSPEEYMEVVMSKVMTKKVFIDFIKKEMAVDKKEKVTEETLFDDDLGFDDLDEIEMVMAIENYFEIEIEDKDADKFETVGDIINYLKDKNLITD